MNTTRILVAHEPERSEVITSALQGYNVVLVTSIDAARYQVMEDGFKLFVIGIHFDDSRAVELVTELRKDGKHKYTPVILVRLLSSPLADFLRNTTELLCKIGTVTKYLELDTDPEPGKAILDAVDKALAARKASAER
ncbi:MAG: hypothetical protein P4L53_28145 [Candidatus Obscuribacterales bacterium]|nr:hypothetical protein [Candidatus Obscuribacterales bacterium]